MPPKVPDSSYEINGRIKAARVRRGYTREQLAQALGVSADAIAKVENRVSKVSLDRAWEFAVALGVAPCEIDPKFREHL